MILYAAFGLLVAILCAVTLALAWRVKTPEVEKDRNL